MKTARSHTRRLDEWRAIELKVSGLTRAIRHSAVLIGLVALIGCTKTYEWEEQVTTHDGRAIQVSRRAKFLTEPISGLPGGSGTRGEQIEFMHGGQRVRWAYPTETIPRNQATILDIVADVPVVVVPIADLDDCARFGFPLTGAVAFQWRDGEWVRTNERLLPTTLRENLLWSGHIKEPLAEPYRNKLITVHDLVRLERDRKRRTLQEIADAPDPFDRACRYFKPPDNPARDALARTVMEKLASAGTVQGTVVEGPRGMVTASREEEERAIGVWSNFAYVRDCEHIVSRVRWALRLDVAGELPQRRNIGVEIVLADSSGSGSIILPLSHWESPSSVSIASVFCVGSKLNVITRRSRTSAGFLQFASTGHVVDGAVLIELPVPDSFPPTFWPTLWDPQVVDGQLRFKLARFERYNTGGGELWDSYSVVVELPK